jgi:ACT domain-containing protein
MRAIMTVIGKDRTGIIAGVSNDLAELNVNILDISQTILQEYFTMIMLVDLADMKVSFDMLKEKLEKRSESLGVSIKLQHEDIFNSMHQI